MLAAAAHHITITRRKNSNRKRAPLSVTPMVSRIVFANTVFKALLLPCNMRILLFLLLALQSQTYADSAKASPVVHSFSLVKFDQYEPKTGSACITKNLIDLANTLINGANHLQKAATDADLTNDMMHTFCELLKFKHGKKKQTLNHFVKRYWKKKKVEAPEFTLIDSSCKETYRIEYPRYIKHGEFFNSFKHQITNQL